jgi:dTDP-glucose 4,6-dehydratase
VNSEGIPSDSSILVTGGAGFIGSDLVRKLDQFETFKRIYVVDSFTYAADIRRLENVSSNVEIIKTDVSEIRNYRLALSECQYVVHMAAESHVDRSIANGSKFVSSNILGSYVVLEECRKYPEILLVHVSTDEVYGSKSEGESAETDNLNPSSAYSASKASSDLLVLANFKTHQQRIVVTRCTNNFGPFQNGEKFLPTVINNALLGRAIPIYGNGLNQREWIHVSDHNDAILALIGKYKAGEVFNIGSGVRVSNLQLASDVLKILSMSDALITFVEDRKGHDFRYALDSSKIKKFTGWQPQHDYIQSLETTVAWYKAWLTNHGEIYL